MAIFQNKTGFQRNIQHVIWAEIVIQYDIFSESLEYKSNFQKIFGSSSPDKKRLQKMEETFILAIFQYKTGFQRIIQHVIWAEIALQYEIFSE